MNAVGSDHSTGRNSKTNIPRPYPAPWIISSVPYVPPDTIKNVAATSDQSVSLAAGFFLVGIARAGSRGGSVKEINFYSRPPKGKSPFTSPFSRHWQNKNEVAFRAMK